MTTTYIIEQVSDKLYEMVSVVVGKTWAVESTKPIKLKLSDKDHDYVNFVCQGSFDYCQSVKNMLEQADGTQQCIIEGNSNG